MAKQKPMEMTDLVVSPVRAGWEDLGTLLRKTLVSRKFWVALGSILAAVAQEDWATVYQLVMVYLGVQGAVDLVDAYKR